MGETCVKNNMYGGGGGYERRRTNKEISELLAEPSIVTMIRLRQFKWLDHVERTERVIQSSTGRLPRISDKRPDKEKVVEFGLRKDEKEGY